MALSRSITSGAKGWSPSQTSRTSQPQSSSSSPSTQTSSSSRSVIQQGFSSRNPLLNKPEVRIGGGGSGGGSSGVSQSQLTSSDVATPSAIAETTQAVQIKTQPDNRSPRGTTPIPRENTGIILTSIYPTITRETTSGSNGILENKYTYSSGIFNEEGDIRLGETPSRLATQEEINQYFPKELKASVATTTPLQRRIREELFGSYNVLKEGAGNFDTNLSETITSAGNYIGTKTGLTYQGIVETGVKSGAFLPFPASSTFIPNEVKEFQIGRLLGAKTELTKNPLMYGGIYAVSYGIGMGAGYVSSLSPIARTGINYLGIGLTTLYAVEKGGIIFSAPNFRQAGVEFSKAELESTAGYFGFTGGLKGEAQLSGYIRTRGRTEIPLEFLTPKEIITGELPFPKTSSVGEEIFTFKNNPYNLPITKLSGYSGTGDIISAEGYKSLPFKVPTTSYHVTSFELAKGDFTPKIGSSELGGLYVSYGASIRFSRLGGSGSSYKIFPTLKDLSIPTGKPEVAAFQSFEYRYSPIKNVEPFQLEGVTFRRVFKRPAKIGVADIPAIKIGKESEAILRPESGSSKIISEEFFTRINNVRVPINIREPTIIPSSGRISGNVKTQDVINSYKDYPILSRFGKYSNLPSQISIPSTSSYKSILSSSPPKGYSILSNTKSYKSIISSSSSSKGSLYSSFASYSYSGYSKPSNLASSLSSSILSPPPSLRLNFGEKTGSRRIKGRKPRRKYTPSYEALVFNIRGKQPKKVTGIGIRPIPKGFKWEFGRFKL